jgi:hypothetical protein
MNHNALKEAPGGNIVTTWNPWGFHKTVSMLFLTQWSCLPLQVYFHLSPSISDRERIHGRTNSRLR